MMNDHFTFREGLRLRGLFGFDYHSDTSDDDDDNDDDAEDDELF